MRVGMDGPPRPAGPLPYYGRANFYNYRDHCNGAATPAKELGDHAGAHGGFGVSILGAIADRFGVESALKFIMILPLTGLLLSLPILYPRKEG
jgi:hypothetical protein